MRIEFGFAYFQLPYYLPPTIRFRPDSFVYCYNNNILAVCSIVAMRPVLFWHRPPFTGLKIFSILKKPPSTNVDRIRNYFSIDSSEFQSLEKRDQNII